MNTDLIKLKVNIKSLAAESKFIRKEQNKIKAQHTGDCVAFRSLAGHRTGAVRQEARAAQLLYAFLRGRQYRQVEPKADWSSYDFKLMCDRLEAKCKKYHIRYEKVVEWLGARQLNPTRSSRLVAA